MNLHEKLMSMKNGTIRTISMILRIIRMKILFPNVRHRNKI